ncbi:MAG: class I SAM-dependent methyltransferase [Ignavibacteriae bacterium]|nr:class I SAM-dependent methyltransferase [Ignavibacteriota bacterium]
MKSEKRFGGIVAEEYEHFIKGTPHYEKFVNRIASEVKKYCKDKPNRDINVIDIGTGYGFCAKFVLKICPNLQLVALDNERNMTLRAKKYLQEYIANGNTTVVLTDALTYLRKLPNDSIDIYFSSWVIHNFQQNYRTNIYKQMYRTLKPGGLFLNADKYAWDNEIVQNRELEWQVSKFFEIFSSQKRYDILEEWVVHYIRDESPKLVMKERTSIEQMKKVGFTSVQRLAREHMECVIKSIVKK